MPTINPQLVLISSYWLMGDNVQGLKWAVYICLPIVNVRDTFSFRIGTTFVLRLRSIPFSYFLMASFHSMCVGVVTSFQESVHRAALRRHTLRGVGVHPGAAVQTAAVVCQEDGLSHERAAG